MTKTKATMPESTQADLEEGKRRRRRRRRRKNHQTFAFEA